jgi:hypothetical protein
MGSINVDYVQLLPLLLSRLEEEIIRILSTLDILFLSNMESKNLGGRAKKRESLSVYCGILKVRVAAASLVLREALMLL